MLNSSSEGTSQNGYVKKSPFAFISNLFKRKKNRGPRNDVKFKDCAFGAMESGSGCPSTSPKYKNTNYVPRVPSTLSVNAVDVMVQTTCCPSSPTVSTITLTPGRTRDIDQDMAALRLSRQDNPFLQVLASRESLVDSVEESESDDANLMSQEFPADLDVDPLTLPEIHEHMIRSPPPVSWPKSPNFKVFRFPLQSSDDESSQDSLTHSGKKTPLKLISPRHSRGHSSDCLKELSAEALSSCQVPTPTKLGSSPHQHRSSSESRERSPKPFLLLNPEVRRLSTRSSDDNVQLVSKNDEYERRSDMDITPNLPLLLAKRSS